MMKRSYQQLLESADKEPIVKEDGLDEYNSDSRMEFNDYDNDTHDDFEEAFGEIDEEDTLADKALAESITQYTMFEMLNTLQFKSFNLRQTKELAMKIAYDLK